MIMSQEKTELFENLNELKALSVEEYTFALKWDQLFNITVADEKTITWAKNDIWAPPDLNDEKTTIEAIERLKPKIIIVDDEKRNTLWSVYRHFVSSAVNYTTPGRCIKFFVVDTNQPARERGHWVHLRYNVLGIGALSGDFPALAPRDTFIGWTKEQREGGKLNHVAVGSTIIPTQPFGYNFLGGKLIASLITSEVLRDEWQLQYGDVLAGMTTTSLFGGRSMYDDIPHWNNLGVTSGKVPIQPRVALYTKWLQKIKGSQAKKFTEMMRQDDDVSGPVTNYKTKVLTMIYKDAGLKLSDYQHGHERGIYFSEFYENTKKFLCGKATDDELKIKPLFSASVEQVTDRWRERAIRRYRQQKKKGTLKDGKLFYDILDRCDYATAKRLFLDEVGR
jgi:Domain of unknown function (DUF4338)